MPYELKLSARLFSGGVKCFGPGAAALLEGVDRHGSLRAAAAEMSMAYSKAWTVLRDCETALGFPLLDRSAGGPKGGGARLTGRGRALLSGFRALESALERQGETLLETILKPEAP